jgi:ABC-2 type transport system permease protein
MISWKPISAIVLRHTRLWRRDMNTLLFHLYWPVLDIFVWGFVGTWIQQSQAIAFHNYEMVALLGVLLWQIVGRGCNIIINCLTEELWASNVVNLFSSPLCILEWIAGVVIFYIIMMILISTASLGFIFALYNVSMVSIMYNFLLFCPPLFFSGIWLGFTALQIIIMLGRRGVELGFVLVWFFMPFSGAYYPIEVLPHWGQVISSYLPMSYVFQGMRGYLMHQQNPTSYLIKGYTLGILYATISLILFVYCFNRRKKSGLARLGD